MSGKIIDLTGQVFGRWTVIGFKGIDSIGGAIFLSECKCGTRKAVKSNDLRRGHSTSCGCYLRELKSSHKMSRTPTYKVWSGIKKRCNNPKSTGYKNYGGKGIKVCKRWYKFENFLKDMGEIPSGNHSIERIDNNGNYKPSNCKWATLIEQANNTSRNVFLSHNGKNQTIAEWSRDTGIKRGTISARLKNGWSIEETLTKPTRVLNNSQNIL